MAWTEGGWLFGLFVFVSFNGPARQLEKGEAMREGEEGGGEWGSEQGPNEKRLLKDIFSRNNYNRLERPVYNESKPLDIQFGLVLQQIIDVDEKNQILTTNIWLNLDEKNQILQTNIWLRLIWHDYNMEWNETEYGGIKSIRIPPHLMWKPDILMYNSADEDIDSTYPTNVVVSSDGNCLWVPPGLFLSTCKIDITWFPFDDQKCSLKFGSWTYDGSAINLTLQGDGGDISSFIPNGEWELIEAPGVRTISKYDCCPEEYIDINFTVAIRRRKLYYVFNLVVPCLMLNLLSLVVFTMPPDAGEKVTCGMPGERNVNQYECCPEQYIDITFTIHIRRRTLYFGFNLIIPCVLISSMALLTFMLPPDAGEKISLDDIITTPKITNGVTILLSLTVFLLLVAETMPPTSDAVPLIGMYFACIMLMCSLSVVFTVLVLNFHHRTPDTHQMPRWVKRGICEWLAWLLRVQRPGSTVPKKRRTSSLRMRDLELSERCSKSLLANVLDLDDDFRGIAAAQSHNSNHNHTSSNRSTEYCNNAPPPSYGLVSEREQQGSTLKDILSELKYISAKKREDDEFADVCNDWKFAAIVVDRFCLWMFTVFTIVSTCAILFSAPHDFGFPAYPPDFRISDLGLDIHASLVNNHKTTEKPGTEMDSKYYATLL
ncbi:hypothetical protein CAPTEDRAFT_221893 [Capitella teleta]|uniref:Uncharacterized protein n=1 Tax=Capitella teleta TaxID=283909 RepID=R7T751_CAPTE|nr:hypothetical protein CAPTEDRAFT_221893 [Capitella teleta]|eukprot:ELT87200.1 hypothetical protein CAPTEDRAFT_221893 [Capitella teleta]